MLKRAASKAFNAWSRIVDFCATRTTMRRKIADAQLSATVKRMNFELVQFQSCWTWTPSSTRFSELLLIQIYKLCWQLSILQLQFDGASHDRSRLLCFASLSRFYSITFDQLYQFDCEPWRRLFSSYWHVGPFTARIFLFLLDSSLHELPQRENGRHETENVLTATWHGQHFFVESATTRHSEVKRLWHFITENECNVALLNWWRLSNLLCNFFVDVFFTQQILRNRRLSFVFNRKSRFIFMQIWRLFMSKLKCCWSRFLLRFCCF